MSLVTPDGYGIRIRGAGGTEAHIPDRDLPRLVAALHNHLARRWLLGAVAWPCDRDSLAHQQHQMELDDAERVRLEKYRHARAEGER